jgi:hypothetical protein
MLNGPRHGRVERRRRVYPGPAATVVATVGVDVENVATPDGAALHIAERGGRTDANEPEPLSAGEGWERIRVLKPSSPQQGACRVS